MRRPLHMSDVYIFAHGNARIGANLDAGDVLWRYLDAAKFLDFLHNNTLFFCRGDQFEDKFEGSFTQSLRHTIEESYKVNNIPFTYEEFRRRVRERVFVNCWHRSKDDSMAMWNLCGQSNCSVAITTTVGKLKASLEEHKLPYCFFLERVSYVKHWRDPQLNINPYSRVFAYKVKAYEYEKEVRILLDRSVDEFSSEISEKGMSIKVKPSTLLRSIVVAPEAPDWFHSLVRQLVERYDVSAPVHRSKLATAPF